MKEDGDALDFSNVTSHSPLSADARKITVLSDGKMCYFNEGKLLPFDFTSGTGEAIVSNLGEIRYTATDGENVYYSTANGVYKIDVSKQTTSLLISAVADKKLFNLVEPQGVSYHDGMLYIADRTMNTVYEFDLDKNELTDLAVTDRGDSHVRLDGAVDFDNDGAEIFTLEHECVKSYDIVTGRKSAYTLSGLRGARLIAADGGYIFLADSSYPYVVKRDGESLKEVAISGDASKFKNVTDVKSHEGAFYFINNESINSVMTACFYRLSTLDMRIEKIGGVVGTGLKLTSDVFGNFYVCVKNGNVFEYYSFNIADFEATFSTYPLFTTTTEPLSLFVDIESDVYALFDGGVMRCFPDLYGADPDLYQIVLSDNLPADTKIKEALLIGGTTDVYFLSDSVLLKAEDGSALGESIVTPSRLAVPEDYKIELDLSPTLATVKKGAKLFTVEPPTLNEQKGTSDRYFTYADFTVQTADDEYIVLSETEKYFLLSTGTYYALARREDVTVFEARICDYNGEYYMVSAFGVSCYPQTDGYFENGRLSVDQKVTANGAVTFNGVKYVYVSAGEVNGFVPETLLKTAVSDDNTPTDYYTVKIAKGGATVFKDEALTEAIGSLEAEKQYYALSGQNGVVKIIYGDGVAYISSANVASSTSYSIKNIIVISALFIALLSSLIYLLKTRVFSKKSE